jgi:hypothetical protein
MRTETAACAARAPENLLVRPAGGRFVRLGLHLIALRLCCSAACELWTVLRSVHLGSHRGLHAAKLLLADEELYVVEDIIADEDDADGRVAALITLSGKMAGDGAFARQLRRKYA